MRRADRGSTSRTPSVVARLAERRLLTVSEGTVEVAHEALLREWPRLRGWLDEDAQGRRVHRALGDAARAWDARRARPRRALPRRAAGRRARLGGRPRRRARRDRARVPRRRPPRERARPAPAAARCSPASRRCSIAGRDRRRRRARPAQPGARAGDAAAAQRSAPRRWPRTTSTARCCSRARASRSTTRCRRAATCSPRCSRARRRSACSRRRRAGWPSLALSPDGRTLARRGRRGHGCGSSTPARGAGARAPRVETSASPGGHRRSSRTTARSRCASARTARSSPSAAISRPSSILRTPDARRLRYSGGSRAALLGRRPTLFAVRSTASTTAEHQRPALRRAQRPALGANAPLEPRGRGDAAR